MQDYLLHVLHLSPMCVNLIWSQGKRNSPCWDGPVDFKSKWGQSSCSGPSGGRGQLVLQGVTQVCRRFDINTTVSLSVKLHLQLHQLHQIPSLFNTSYLCQVVLTQRGCQTHGRLTVWLRQHGITSHWSPYQAGKVNVLHTSGRDNNNVVTLLQLWMVSRVKSGDVIHRVYCHH